MSALLQLQPRRFAGQVPVHIAATPPDHYCNGKPFVADGRMAVATTGAITHYHQGLPFTAEGRIAVELALQNPDYVGNGAAPFAASGRLLMDTGTNQHVAHGVGYTTESAIHITTTPPPPI